MDSEDLLRAESVALRVRGTLNLVSGQNENDLHIAFKHLIEKVGKGKGLLQNQKNSVCISLIAHLLIGY